MPLNPFYEVNQAIQEMGGKDLNRCMQCGLCSAVCPWREVESEFYIRKMIRQGQLGLEGYESADVLFACTTCNRCVMTCPREVKIIDIVRSMRSLVTEAGVIPESLKAAIGSCHSNGNPWSGPREKRLDWAIGLNVPFYGPDTEYLLFVCCTSCYDIRSRNIARATVRLLQSAGVSFGVLGTEESCCGESIRKVGAEEEFLRLAESNIRLFQERGVKKIITISPHCLYAFTKDYREMGADFEVIHTSQLFRRLAKEGILRINIGKGLRIAYHDPCYLGRHMGIFEEPRELIKATGCELVEMDRSRQFSLCCGGGGGRLWMETDVEQRFSVLRAKEAVEAGADVLLTSCPYCLSMLEDGLKASGIGDALKVMELSEFLAPR